MGKNKRSRSYYIQSAKRHKQSSLGPTMTGFLCTCNANERDCVREAYNILNEYADGLYGKEFPDEEMCKLPCKETELPNALNKEKSEKQTSLVADSDEEEEDSMDIETALKADVSVLQKSNEAEKKKKRRFHQVQSGAKNCVFIQTTLEDPLSVSLAMMDDLLSTQKQKTKKLLRMLPVQATCKAFPDDIKKAVEELAMSYFKDEGKAFCIIFKVRNNTNIKKENMVIDLAKIVQNVHSNNIPDLICPDVVVNVNVIKNVCCLSILPDYFTKYCKYNLVLLANQIQMNEKTDVKEESKVQASTDDEASIKTNDEKLESKDTNAISKSDVEADREEENGELKIENELIEFKVKNDESKINSEIIESEINNRKTESLVKSKTDGTEH